MTEADVSDLIVTDAYTDAHNGVTHVYLRQSLGGLEVLGANMTVNVGRDGRVVYAPSAFVRNLAQAASGQVGLGVVAAVESGADELGLELTSRSSRALRLDPFARCSL